MKRNEIVGLSLVAVLVAFALAGCASAQVADGATPHHNSRDSLDWWGVYEGTIPSASGSGIDVSLTIKQDLNFELSYEYVGRDDGMFVRIGTFQWNDTGSVITLVGEDEAFSFPQFYQVGEGFLRQLDIDGNTIEGELADNYKLQKVE